ncbi:hypothetical protein Bca4012_016942 [Brassica carinata]
MLVDSGFNGGPWLFSVRGGDKDEKTEGGSGAAASRVKGETSGRACGVASRLLACRSESCGRKDGLILRSVRRGACAEVSGAYSACSQLNDLSCHVNCGGNSPEVYQNSLEERRFTLDKRSLDIGVMAPYRRSCSSGSRRQSVVRLRAPPPGQWESNEVRNTHLGAMHSQYRIECQIW